jgi:PAS domain S-box-containing protein
MAEYSTEKVPDAYPSVSPSVDTSNAFQNTIPDAFVTVDAAGVVLEWNPGAQALLGWQAAEIVGFKPTELHLPLDYRSPSSPGLPIFIRSSPTKQGGRGTVNYLAINANGEEFPVEISASREGSTGKAECNRFQIRDLRPRMVVEARMMQAAKMEAIGQLVSGLAHDFNNILGIIHGSLETLGLRITDATQRELVQLATLATERGKDITRTLQAIARRRPQKAEQVSLNQALMSLLPLLKQSATRSIDIAVVAEAAESNVMIDPGGFNNAILNFVINARDASPNGGLILVYTQNIAIRANDPVESVDLAPGNYIVVGVDDNGMGMPADIAARAMEPFFTTKSKNEGTGLGLSMAYAFARQSNGALRIQSTPGKGTSIHLFLPLQPAQPTAEAEQP